MYLLRSLLLLMTFLFCFSLSLVDMGDLQADLPLEHVIFDHRFF